MLAAFCNTGAGGIATNKKISDFVGYCLFVCGYPFSSSGWRYGMNGNPGSCRQPRGKIAAHFEPVMSDW